MHHALLDDRSLVFARAIAERLRERPELMQVARENLHRWMTARPASRSRIQNCREWLDIIEQNPPESVIGMLLRADEEGRRLRQNNPFVGVLTQQEVVKVKQEFAHAARGA